MELLVKNTHFKIVLSDEEHEIREFLKNKFTYKDAVIESQNKRLPKHLHKDPYRSFYDTEFDIMPTGLLPYARVFLTKKGIKYEMTDLRSFPKHSQEFIESPMAFIGKDRKTYAPREYQIEVINELVRKKGGCINIATGTGKGFIHALICHTWPKAKILNLFDRVDLIDQTFSAFTEKYGFSKKDIGIIQGTRKEIDKRIILMSVMSYENAVSIFPDVQIIIGDEAHSTMRTAVAEKIIYMCQNAGIKIGLSATIDKISNPYEQVKLYSLAGPIIYNKEIKENIDEGNLSPGDVIFISYSSPPVPITRRYQDTYETHKADICSFKSLKVKEGFLIKKGNKEMKLTEDQLNVYEQKRELGPIHANKFLNETLQDFLEESMKQEGWEFFSKKGERFMRRFLASGDETEMYINNAVRNQIICDTALEQSAKGKRTVILFSRISHGKLLKEMLPNALLISGINTKEERNEVQNFIKENKNAIVIVSTIWQTGVDIPQLEVFINATGGRSAIALIQRIGRLTRKSEGKKKFWFYDFIDSHLNSMALKQTNERIKIVKDLKLPIFNKESK